MHGVHALTDVTGFGLAGHLLEICRGSKLAARSDVSTHSRHRRGARLGEAGRRDRRLGPQLDRLRPRGRVPRRGDWQQKLLTDPQTSGGLLVACAPEAEKAVLEVFRQQRLRRGAHHRQSCVGRAARGWLVRFEQRLQSASRRASSISGCAGSFGWMRSGWKNSGLPAKSSSMNGTSGVAVRFRQLAVSALERAGVDLAVVRRQPHADQQHARAGASATRWMIAARLVFICVTGRPRRPSLPPSSSTTIAGRCLSSSGLMRARAAAAGFARDARVHDAIIQPLALQALLEQRHPAALARHAVRRGQAVAEHQDRFFR